MDVARRWRSGAVVAASALVTAAVLTVVAPGWSGAEGTVGPVTPRTCAEMAREARSDVPFDTVYDPGRGLLLAHGLGLSYALDLEDPACRGSSPVVRDLIDDALAVHAQNVADECAFMRAFLARGAKELRGRKVDRAAGERFVAESCQRG